MCSGFRATFPCVAVSRVPSQQREEDRWIWGWQINFMVLPGIDIVLHFITFYTVVLPRFSGQQTLIHFIYYMYMCVSFQKISIPPFFLRPSSRPSVTPFKIDQNKIQNRLTSAIEFCYKIVDFSLEKLETIKLILFLIQEPPRRPNFPKQVPF